MRTLDLQELSAACVLVIAPHPDDESLGCGGLIAMLCGEQRTVHVVFVTEGGASHLHSPSWPRARLAKQRQEEAIEALRRLGAGGQQRSFLGLLDAAMPDRQSAGWTDAVDRLAAIIADLQPRLVVLPWRRDPHRDHRDSWALAQAAMQQGGAAGAAQLEYAVWLDEIGAPTDFPQPGEAERVRLPIEDVRERKRAAIAAHLSQTTDLIADDPSAFRLTEATIDRLSGPHEHYLRPLA